MAFIRKLFGDERGQALSEYGLVLGVVVISVIVTLAALKDKIIALYNKIVSSFPAI